MTRGRNPAGLSSEERLAEIAALLATGYRRIQLKNSESPLAERPESEAPCDPVMNSAKSAFTKESA